MAGRPWPVFGSWISGAGDPVHFAKVSAGMAKAHRWRQEYLDTESIGDGTRVFSVAAAVRGYIALFWHGVMLRDVQVSSVRYM